MHFFIALFAGMGALVAAVPVKNDNSTKPDIPSCIDPINAAKIAEADRVRDEIIKNDVKIDTPKIPLAQKLIDEWNDRYWEIAGEGVRREQEVNAAINAMEAAEAAKHEPNGTNMTSTDAVVAEIQKANEAEAHAKLVNGNGTNVTHLVARQGHGGPHFGFGSMLPLALACMADAIRMRISV